MKLNVACFGFCLLLGYLLPNSTAFVGSFLYWLSSPFSMMVLEMCLGGMIPVELGKIYRQISSGVGLVSNNFIQANDAED